jgi:hypothetical protein
MNASIVSLILCLLLCGCDFGQVHYVDVADPELLTKSKLSEQDWLQIKQLASVRREFVILDLRRVAGDVIEIRLKKPGDTRNDQGGPMARFEKHEGQWALDTKFNGDWWAARGSETK